MGSFTPLASGWWDCVSAWGILTSVLIRLCLLPIIRRCSLFVSRWSLAVSCWFFALLSCYFDELRSLRGSGDRNQFRRFRLLGGSFFRFFAHVRNLDAFQHGFNALIHLAQRLADVAAVALIALPANRDAGGDEQRAIDGLNHFKSGNRVGRASQRVSAVGAVLRLQQASFSQALQNLRQSLGRNAVGVGDILGAA